ncbi:MAG: 2-keto-4-pentenoate hydratase [Erythrobacteraceae bacterium]|nr:2-keto-4-pentenoate hydratase [Erythrobacteraceae bacterium]
MTAAARDIANAFVEARRSGTAIAQYPGERPQDLAAAYEIQDCALAVWNRTIGGWKVGKINPPDDARLGANRLVGPVFSDLIFEAGPDTRPFKTFAGGFAAAEAEFMMRIAPQSGPMPATNRAAMDWVDEIRIGLEIASSPYSRINADGPCVTVSDHGNNAGLLLGQHVPVELWQSLDDVDVALDVASTQVGRATTATMLDGPFGAVRFLLGNLTQRGIAPEAGWWVSSGAITGVHTVASGDEVTATFADIGTVSAKIA